MAIKEAIVHFIDKPEGEGARLIPRQSPLSLNPALDELISKMAAVYNNRSGKIYGGFELDEDSYPFSRWLGQYLQNEVDLVQLSNSLLNRLKTLLDDQQEAFSGYVLVVRQQVLEVDQLLLLVLSTNRGMTINENLELTDASHLDLGKLQLGARVNLDSWTSKDDRQYISYVKSLSGKSVSECFRKAVGNTEELDSKEQTQTLLKVFNDYCAKETLEAKQESEVKQRAYEYCTERAESGGRVELQELSCVMDTTDPDKFFNYVSEQDASLAASIPADKRGLRRFVRYSGSMKGVSISFSEQLLGDQVIYDPDADTLVIRGVPPSLKKQLGRSGD